MRGQMPGGRVRLRVKPGWVGQWGGGCAPLPKVYPEPCRDGSLSRVQGCAHTGLSLIWEQQGDWAGGRWGWPGRAVMPSGQLPVPVFAEGHG